MNCPYCHKEMKLGYIQCRDGIYWTPKKQWLAALSGWGKGSIRLQNGASDVMQSAVYAYRCKECKTVIISYDDTEI